MHMEVFNMEPVLHAQGLSKYYGKSRGIIDLSLSVPRGDVFGFIGPNGAGKSTTIRLLLGLIAPSKGTVSMLGMDCWRDRVAIAKRVGYMPSEASFYHGMRGFEIISFAAKLHGRDCGKEAARLCERFEVETQKKVEELSLGNRRKLSIVCAFQHEPELLILDEPTSGLDPLMQNEFFALLGERNLKGATIFLSSHALSIIQRHCLHAGIVREGKLIALDTVENLTRTSARRVHLVGVQQAPDLPGIADVRQSNGDGISFLYNGAARPLLAALSHMPVDDVTITEPDLEEIFMHFYREEVSV